MNLLVSTDFIFRGVILLGIAVSIFTNVKKVTANRKANEKRPVLKYYKTWLQQVPIWTSIISALLMGLAIWRFGSLLLIQENSENKLVLLNYIIMETDELRANQYYIFALSAVGGVVFVVFSIIQALSYQALDRNFSSYIDIKEGNYLVQEGVYGVIRHPLYLCEIILPIAASFALLAWPLFLWGVFVQMPLYIMRTTKEEELLEHYYGKEFLAYRQMTGRFMPSRSKGHM
jgi:protein-S-isoprenylcysteine O-methyltransferase Ste14